MPPCGARSSGCLSRQNSDGGWGESNDSYAKDRRSERKCASTPYQTAWALLALLASGEAASDAVRRGVNHLMRTQQADGLWSDPHFTAPGFPRVFYLKYHGYSRYFPLWALAAYRTSDPGRDRTLTVAGVVAALAAEARALGPAAAAAADRGCSRDGTLLCGQRHRGCGGRARGARA